MQTVSYRPTVADLVDARRYAYNSLPIVRAIRLVPFILTLAWLLLGVYRAFHRDWNGAASPGDLLLFGPVLIFWMYVSDRWLLPSSVRKQMARNKILIGDRTVSWDAERIIFETSHAQSRWPWSDFHRWKESSGGLFLWSSDWTYFYLPKRLLANSQVSEIRANLTNAVGRPGKWRK